MGNDREVWHHGNGDRAILAWEGVRTVIHESETDSHSYQWQAGNLHRLQLEGEKSIFFSTTILFTCYQHPLLPIFLFLKAVPFQRLQTWWLNKDRSRRASKALEMVSFYINAKFSASVRLQLWQELGCFLCHVFSKAPCQKILIHQGNETNRFNYFKTLWAHHFYNKISNTTYWINK